MGSVTIEKNYYDQYSTCQAEKEVLMGDFEEFKESKSIQCPDVECKPGSFGWMILIIASIFYAYSLFHQQRTNKQLDDREEDLKLRETQLKSRLIIEDKFKEKRSRRKK